MNKLFFYFLTGFVFSIGLAMGGMLVPVNIKRFLELLYPQTWSPLLLIVLGFAVLAYSLLYWRQVRCGQSCMGKFEKLPQGKIDRKLILGAILFGAGWGLSGVCPAPALARIAIAPLEVSTWVFLVAMFAGFKLEEVLKK